MASWYETGTVVPAQEEKEMGKKGPSRFWLRKRDGVEAVFIDDEGFRVWEHNLPKFVDGERQFGNFFTCTKRLPEGCLPCEKGDRASVQVFFTVWNCKEFEGRDGSIVHGFRQLLVIGKQQLGRIEMWKERLGSLKGQKFLFYRTDSDKAARVGDDWAHKGPVDLMDFAYERKDGSVVVPEPYDYEEILQPKDRPTIMYQMGWAKKGAEVVPF